jgi:FKBP-type peptidyl-prolyl cis-trans isomerase FkpA
MRISCKGHYFAPNFTLMKKLIPVILILLVVAVGISSCLKNETTTPTCTPVTVTAPSTEVATLKAYLDSNGIAATQDSRGFFYSLDTSASTSTDTLHPTACSDVSVTYRGTLQTALCSIAQALMHL